LTDLVCERWMKATRWREFITGQEADISSSLHGPSFLDTFRRSAGYFDRILNAADLPVQAPSKFEMVVNLKIARAMSLRSICSTAAEAIDACL
jgi:hypothetical protein